MNACSFSFERDGAVRHDRAALFCLDAIDRALASQPVGRPGQRLFGIPALADMLRVGAIADVARQHAGDKAKPVRAILFDKTRDANWALSWHQDRTIAVRCRDDAPGYGPWTIKAGVTHVEPTFSIVESMVTLRIHLDPVPVTNGPLIVVPGSHRLGRIAERDIPSVVDVHGTVTCLAEAGDIWAYATPILHASGPASGGSRRVLQVDYSSAILPAGLDWIGIS